MNQTMEHKVMNRSNSITIFELDDLITKIVLIHFSSVFSYDTYSWQLKSVVLVLITNLVWRTNNNMRIAHIRRVSALDICLSMGKKLYRGVCFSTWFFDNDFDDSKQTGNSLPIFLLFSLLFQFERGGKRIVKMCCCFYSEPIKYLSCLCCVEKILLWICLRLNWKLEPRINCG